MELARRGPACEVLIVVGVLLWLVNRFIAHASTIILISASFGPSLLVRTGVRTLTQTSVEPCCLRFPGIPELSTWQWADRLKSAYDERNLPALCGLAVRVLGRLVTDRGDVHEHPFASIPHATEMARSHEIHLQSWWNLMASRSDDSTRDFLVRLMLDWVIFRHLRVATRKLASQGVSTYKFRPEEGKLVLVAERLPTATFTSPRVRQA